MNTDDDFMEIGESGLVPLGQGWILDTKTGNKKSPDGHIFSKYGEMLFKAETVTEEEEEEEDPQ